jgi:signal transduction histidine kinase
VTRPLLRISVIAERITRLDFSQKYEGRAKDEIGLLGRSVNTMSERLERAIGDLRKANADLLAELSQKERVENMRKQFLSNASHELKTPLSLVKGYAEGLRDAVADEDNRGFYCDVILDESEKMEKLVGDVLSLAQLESAPDAARPEAFDLAELLRGVLARYKLLFQKKGIAPVLDAPEKLAAYSDPRLVEQIFTNYLSNALNHADENKRIEIRAAAFRPPDSEKERVRVSVFNSGKGFTGEEARNIWQSFYKLDTARTRTYGGNGLGLSICKAAAEAIGGCCGVLTLPDEGGVEFFFEF